MKLPVTWGTALVAGIAVAAIAGACSAVNGSTPAGAGGATGNGGSAAPGGNGVGGDSGSLFGDSAPSDAAPDQASPPGTCDPASCVAAGGKCASGTCTLVENPGNVDPGTQAKLKAGGTADAAFAFLYPYDHTVFPRGLLPPTLQFAGAAPDAAYVHVSFSGLEYDAFYGASSPGRIVFSAAVWKAMTLAGSGKDNVKVEVTKISGGQVSAKVTETWTIAPGSLRGTIYYETYSSQLATIAGGIGGVGIMKLQPGATAPTVFKSGCGNVCHTASADGSTLVSATGFIGASVSYDLKNNASVILAQNSESFTYGGLYPDGKFLMSATNYRTWLPSPSRLYDTKTGANIPAAGWDNAITNGGTPAFSPDGKKLVFNHEDTGAGHTLAVMDFDVSKMSFSNLADLAYDPKSFLGWPAFTPDAQSVVYHAGSSEVFETDSGATGELFYADVATKKPCRLDALDGYANGQLYLPANDPGLNFAPTVLPEAVGGYFWVVFTSHRSYGNTLPSKDNGGQNGKLWVSAFDLNPTPGKDASHPAFYLDGQETAADNLRGFWVLDPCKSDGTDCNSGDECCDGFCRKTDGGVQCVPPLMGGCSNEFEKCQTATDCCTAGYQCINGHCAQPPPH